MERVNWIYIFWLLAIFNLYMKKLLILIFVAVIGVLCGVVSAFVQVRLTSARVELLPEELAKPDSGVKPSPVAGELIPKAVVDSEIFDFGVMDKSGRSSHDFIVTNKGTAPLTLAQWGVCAAMASGVLWAQEIAKLALRAGAQPGGVLTGA